MPFDYYAKQISLRDDEQIIGIIHHHPVTYLKQIAITIILILLAFFLMFYLVSLGPLGVSFFAAFLLTGIFYGAREFFIWYSNVLMITNQRLIDIDQAGFFSKTVSEVPYDKILDICYSVKGVAQTIFRLGTIKIQATGAKLVIKNVSDIVQVNQIITDLIKNQTGKQIEIKKVKQLTPQAKAQVTEDFFNQDELSEYEQYKLAEVIADYKETFGELKLKKILVDELAKYEEAEDSDSAEVAEDESDDEDIGGNVLDQEDPRGSLGEIVGEEETAELDLGKEPAVKEIKPKFRKKRL
jgi:hypothetical protein